MCPHAVTHPHGRAAVSRSPSLAAHESLASGPPRPPRGPRVRGVYPRCKVRRRVINPSRSPSTAVGGPRETFMARVILTILGGFRARLGGDPPVILPSRKIQACVAYLALPPGRPHSRDGPPRLAS